MNVIEQCFLITEMDISFILSNKAKCEHLAYNNQTGKIS